MCSATVTQQLYTITEKNNEEIKKLYLLALQCKASMEKMQDVINTLHIELQISKDLNTSLTKRINGAEAQIEISSTTNK